MKTAAEIAVSLIDSHRPDAARALLEADTRASRAEAELKAYKFELDWLLRHARRLPVDVHRDDVIPHEDGGTAITPVPDGRSYVLADCPRLLSIMAGELPHVDRSR